MPCGVVDVTAVLGEPTASLCRAEDRGSMFFLNVSEFLPECTTLYPRRQQPL